jgi:bifunctional enzyme CysN/CysC
LHAASATQPFQENYLFMKKTIITKKDREELNGHQSGVVWLTGLSGSGKSTIANELEISLHKEGIRTFVLDGDKIRSGLNSDLGFSNSCRTENIRRLAEVAKLMMDAGLLVITASISPFREDRRLAKILIGSENFTEVYIDVPLAVCELRDPKGLYERARKGNILNMTGIDSPYEEPLNPEIHIKNADITVADAVDLIKLNLIAKKA